MYRPVAPKKEMTRSEITELFVVRAAPAERDELRRTLDRMTAEQLQTAYEALQRQVELEATEERFHKALAESAAEDLRHHLRMQEAREPQRKQQEQKDRETFNEFARENGFSQCEANHHIVKTVLQSGFDKYLLAQAVQSNALQLAPAGQEELIYWDQRGRVELAELIGPRIAQSEYRHTIRQYIQTSSTYQQLRDRVQLCGEIADNHSPDQFVNNREFCLLLLAKTDTEIYRSRVAGLRENKKVKAMSPLEVKAYLAKKREEQQPSFEERVAAEVISPQDQTLLEAVNNDPRPPLPETTASGEVIDAAYLQKMRASDYTTYRELLQRHGRLRLEARIRGVK